MNLTVYVWKLAEKEKELLDIIIEKALDLKEYQLIELALIPNHRPTQGDTLLCFGTRAFNLISAEYPQAVRLPLLSQLKDVPANRSYRVDAWSTLQNIKNLPSVLEEDNQIDISPEDLMHNLTLHSKDLIRHIQEDKTEYWIGTTALGRKVLISPTPNNNKIKCNFQLTFEELYAAKLAVDLLSLTSLTLVKGKKDD
jgi:hypothetical protein